MAKRAILVLTVCLSLLLAAPFGVLAEDLGITMQQQSLYNEMMKIFIAPDFCGKSLEDCPAGITVEMREGILQQVKDGADKEEIIDYWTGVYGMKILAAPPKSGFFLSAWVLPIIGILVGALILSGVLRRRMGVDGKNKPNKSSIPGEYEEELKQEVLKHL